jgi:DNA-binding ferritin-like protein
VAIAQKAEDEGSADLLIGRSQDHDKTAWMLDAYAAG